MYNREKDHLDDFLREKLGSYKVEPSEGAWSGINSRLGPTGGFFSRFRYYLNQLIFPATTGIILFLAIAFSLSGSDRIMTAGDFSADAGVEANHATMVSPEASSRPSGLSSSSMLNTGAKESVSPEPVAQSSKKQHASTTSPGQGDDEALSSARPFERQEVEPSPGLFVEAPQEIPANKESADALLSEEQMVLTPATGLDASGAENLSRREFTFVMSMHPWNFYNSIPELYPSEQTKYTRQYGHHLYGSLSRKNIFKPEWSIGLFYTPELYHSETSYGEKQLVALDLSTRYRMNRYFLETGLGLSRVSNDNNYYITYNDLIGTFKSLDSISFQIDTTGGNIVPTYYWKSTMVYDSLELTDNASLTNTYTYLQLPLYIGYAHHHKRWSLTVKGGPLLSLLVQRNEADLIYDMGGKRIISIDDNTPGRIRTSWQLMFSGGIQYRLTSHWSISAEPGIRYYLNQVYDSQHYQARPPWSINLRTGILYTF